MKPSTIQFSELRGFLIDLGFKLKKVENAWVFRHPKEGLVIFRIYRDNEPVSELDLRTTRRFLDMRGLLEGGDFDAFLHRATPA